jgi:hypothetical protein
MNGRCANSRLSQRRGSPQSRVPMACHGFAEWADLADTAARIVYNLRVFNAPEFFESHQVHQTSQRLTKTERPKRVFWSPTGVQKWTPLAESAKRTRVEFCQRRLRSKWTGLKNGLVADRSRTCPITKRGIEFAWDRRKAKTRAIRQEGVPCGPSSSRRIGS